MSAKLPNDEATSQEECNVSGPEDVRCRTRDVSSSSAVKCFLKIDFQRCPGKAIRASDLAALIGDETQKGELKSFILDGVRVVGDFSAVTEVLSKCYHLNNFDVFTCRLPKATSSLAAALARLENLTHVCLSFPSLDAPWRVLTPILQNPKHRLKVVFVNGFEAPNAGDSTRNQQVGEFFAACGKSTTLKQFTCLPRSSCSFTANAIVAIADMIRQTSTLEIVKLGLADETNQECVARALQVNQSIRKLILHGCPGGNLKASLAAFSLMLEDHNFTLEELDLKMWETWRPITLRLCKEMQQHLKAIKFFLSLNNTGRAKLLSAKQHLPTLTPADWMEHISGVKDLSSLNYFLKVNPCLFNAEHSRGQGEIECAEIHPAL